MESSREEHVAALLTSPVSARLNTTISTSVHLITPPPLFVPTTVGEGEDDMVVMMIGLIHY